MPLDALIAAEIRATLDTLAAEGKLPSQADLDRYRATFRARFGPEALLRLDGTALLESMHDSGNTGSLVYWLEFKSDAELPPIFGSIAGGSALKFGLYRRRETGHWMAGHATAQRVLSQEEAVALARKHRDEFVAGVAVLDACAANPASVNYDRLQVQMEAVAPTVAELAWGHKYFSLLAPTVLDDFHAPAYQRFHLAKMLLPPPPREGRYIAARGFLDAARELGVPVTNLGTALNVLHGSTPHRYWRVGTGNDEAPRSQWRTMRDRGRIAVGWPLVGDLSTAPPTAEGRDALRESIVKHYKKPAPAAGRAASQLLRFAHTAAVGDIVVAADGETNLAIGRIIGDYRFDATEAFPHYRDVQWLDLREWQFPEAEGLRTTFHELYKAPANRVEIERRLASLRERRTIDPPPSPPPPPLAPLPPLIARVQAALERKGQVILYGPPGTGKTHHAEIAARELAARAWHGVTALALGEQARRSLYGADPATPAAIETCCFHPAYGYEDFLEGYRPRSNAASLGFELREGVFKRLCRRAQEHPARPFYLIIDEINRGDIPRIFGELLMVLEKGRRGATVVLPLSGERFAVPPNVFVIGTMNTADRSIALLDTALRRRFGFVELMPDADALGDTVVAGVPLGPWLSALNERVRRHVGRDARNLQVGHAYLLHDGRPVGDLAHLIQVIRDDIVPLLEEYCYEDYAALERILGPTFVRREAQRVDGSLFDPSRSDDFVRALLEPCPEITTSPQAVRSDAQAVSADDPEDAEDSA